MGAGRGGDDGLKGPRGEVRGVLAPVARLGDHEAGYLAGEAESWLVSGGGRTYAVVDLPSAHLVRVDLEKAG